MAKHTDRYDDKNLIELAKKTHEFTQKSILPTEVVYLPSEGKVYPKSSILREGKVEMRYMTAYDEDILTNGSYIADGTVFDRLLDELITTDISIDDIAAVDKDALIISARIVSYGSIYDVTVTDPKTEKELKRSVDLKTLKTKKINLTPDDNGEFTYKLKNGTTIKYHFLTGHDIKGIDEKRGISSFLSKAIKQVDDSREQQDIDDYIRYKFLVAESKEFRDHIVKNTPGLVMQYEFEGENGSTFIAGFQAGADLLWP